MKLSYLILACTFLSANSSCAQTEDQARQKFPEYFSKEPSCAVLRLAKPASDSEAVTPQQKATQFWDRMEEILTVTLYQRLSIEHQIYIAENPFSQREDAHPIIGYALAQYKCNRVIGLSYNLNEDKNGPFFEFEFKMFKAIPVSMDGANNTTSKLEPVYSKKYRYARNADTISNFHPFEFAEQVIANSRDAGVLALIRK